VMRVGFVDQNGFNGHVSISAPAFFAVCGSPNNLRLWEVASIELQSGHVD